MPVVFLYALPTLVMTKSNMMVSPAPRRVTDGGETIAVKATAGLSARNPGEKEHERH